METWQGGKKLKGVVQNYAWGGKNFLSELLGRDNAEGKPEAEYWLGAHPNHSAKLDGESITLAEWISREGEAAVGAAWMKFGGLPYLMKVLDVRQMLSIQVHPDKTSAIEGYEREDREGIPVFAANRNYRDRNHKPELMAALSDFYLLHGFKEPEALRRVLRMPEFRWLIAIFGVGDYRRLYETVMLMHPSEVKERLEPLVARIVPKYEAGELEKDSEDFWAARAALQYGSGDRGIFSIYFFNLLHLKKGEGIYQPAGLPHAYLEGQNVEIMANSDNVLRAGLTDKYVDVRELLKHVRFGATEPRIIEAEDVAHLVYPSPAEEFELHRYQISGEETIRTAAGETWLLTEGSAEVADGETKLSLVKGEALFVRPGQALRIRGEGAELFRATVPAR